MSRLRILALVACAMIAATAAAQTGYYYTTEGTAGLGQTYVWNNGVLQLSYPWQAEAQMPIAVGDFGSGTPTVRQASGQPPSFPWQGDEYDLGGTPTGVQNYWMPPYSDCTAYDATWDGSYIYMVLWNPNSGPGDGEVWRYDSNYANGQFLFQADGQGAGGDLGITYDSLTNTLWLGGFHDGEVTQYSLAGTRLGSWFIPNGSASALAYDPLNDTFWLSNGQYSAADLYNYDRNGNLLGQFTAGLYMLGGEIYIVPEPTALALWAAGVGVLLARRRR